ncbi:MAG TPA: DUF1684 domain-containing protein [Ktedonobacterales bacterium]|nr:DUF1684 domain-containing protein [Ktedonobacterales bacterium]
MAEEQRGDPARYIREVTEYRQQRDKSFATSPDTPIPEEQQGEHFGGLKYYPPDLAFRVEAEVVPFEAPQVVMLGSTKGDIRRQLRYGELRFRVRGEECRLIAFKDVDNAESPELFVPFRDATSGGETYGAGRYLDVEEDRESDGPRNVILDFNLAYSPWCAYNVAYSCTLPPPENTLSVAIAAGEMSYPVDH